MILFPFGLVPKVEEVLVESGSGGDDRCRPSPVRARLLLPLRLLDFLVVGEESGFAFVCARLRDQATESLEVRGLILTLALLMLLRSQ